MSLTVEKCLQAWTNSLRQMKAKADIVFFGDSLTYYGDFSSLFPDKVVCNLGLRGDTINGMTKRVNQIHMLNPQRLYIMAGLNDVANMKPNEFKERFYNLINVVLNENPQAELILQSMLPVNNIEFNISCDNLQIIQNNHIIEELSSFLQLRYIDLFSYYAEDGYLPANMTMDGIHLNKPAYRIWYDRVNSI